MSAIKSLCVFCGANPGNSPIYAEAATALGRLMAKNKIRLVYGGGNVGLMGTIADAVLAGGGQVIGVIPESLVAKEVAHRGVTELKVVKTMHERKQLMCNESDAFVAMAGGFGTLDEICEILTWNQLGIIAKPTALLNVNGYFDPFVKFLGSCVKEGFIKEPHRQMLLNERTPEGVWRELAAWKAPALEKWTKKSPVKP